jgi:hypothetical protein
MSAAEQGATQGGVPSGDIVALGKIIQIKKQQKNIQI